MKSLNYKQLNKLANDVNEKIKGNHISNIIVLSSNDIIFTFSFYRKEKLLISLNHQSPFISLIESTPSVPSIMGKLVEELRKNIKDTVVKDISSIENERIVKFTLFKTDVFFDKHTSYLYLELIPTHPNLIIADEANKIIYATHYTNLDAKRIILKGMEYVLPLSNIVNNDFSDDISSFKEEVNNYLPSLLEHRLDDKYQKLITTLKSKIKKCKNKVKVLNDEIEEAKKLLIYQEYGSMILAYLYDEEELKNYIKENNVPYDETKSASDNANILFKKYKKAKSTITNNEEQLRLNDEELKIYEEDLASLSGEDESIYLLLSSKYLKTSIPKQEINKLTPYYVLIDGTKIAFGRNANQNDLLTFKKAKDQYYFLHVENIHANHVVIMNNNPTDKDKENAAMLALWLINKEAGNVQIALIKDIKKGHMPGQVLLNKYSVIKINNVTSKIKNSLDKVKRLSF